MNRYIFLYAVTYICVSSRLIFEIFLFSKLPFRDSIYIYDDRETFILRKNAKAGIHLFDFFAFAMCTARELRIYFVFLFSWDGIR